MQIDVNFMQIRMASSARGVGCPSDGGGRVPLSQIISSHKVCEDLGPHS